MAEQLETALFEGLPHRLSTVVQWVTRKPQARAKAGLGVVGGLEFGITLGAGLGVTVMAGVGFGLVAGRPIMYRWWRERKL